MYSTPPISPRPPDYLLWTTLVLLPPPPAPPRTPTPPCRGRRIRRGLRPRAPTPAKKNMKESHTEVGLAAGRPTRCSALSFRYTQTARQGPYMNVKPSREACAARHCERKQPCGRRPRAAGSAAGRSEPCSGNSSSRAPDVVGLWAQRGQKASKKAAKVPPKKVCRFTYLFFGPFWGPFAPRSAVLHARSPSPERIEPLTSPHVRRATTRRVPASGQLNGAFFQKCGRRNLRNREKN